MSKRIPESEWIWLPHPAHFICSNHCRFKLATKIGNVIVSTVGELWFDRDVRKIHDEVHCEVHGGKPINAKGDEYDRLYMKKYGFEDLHIDGIKYETYVFGARPRDKRKSDMNDCCDWMINVQDERESRWYKKASEAVAGHYELCNKYALINNNE